MSSFLSPLTCKWKRRLRRDRLGRSRSNGRCSGRIPSRSCHQYLQSALNDARSEHCSVRYVRVPTTGSDQCSHQRRGQLHSKDPGPAVSRTGLLTRLAGSRADLNVRVDNAQSLPATASDLPPRSVRTGHGAAVNTAPRRRPRSWKAAWCMGRQWTLGLESLRLRPR